MFRKVNKNELGNISMYYDEKQVNVMEWLKTNNPSGHENLERKDVVQSEDILNLVPSNAIVTM